MSLADRRSSRTDFSSHTQVTHQGRRLQKKILGKALDIRLCFDFISVRGMCCAQTSPISLAKTPAEYGNLGAGPGSWVRRGKGWVREGEISGRGGRVVDACTEGSILVTFASRPSI